MGQAGIKTEEIPITANGRKKKIFKKREKVFAKEKGINIIDGV